MPSSSRSTKLLTDLQRADRLKGEIADFATAGPLSQEYERHQKLIFGLSHPQGENEEESVLDWFLFEWFDDNGEGVIEHFLTSKDDIDEKDRDILVEWEDSINSIFEIRSLDKNALRLRDLESHDHFNVRTITDLLSETPFERGQFIAARLLPFGDAFIFAGPQFILPDRESAVEALEMCNALDDIGSPESIEQAQQEQCEAFCEVFGCKELTIAPEELTPTLERLQNYMFFERRDPETKMTMAETFQAKFGVELQILDMPPLPDQPMGAGDVTILCDEFDGIVVLPDYNKFKRVFETDRPEKAVPDWEELVWNYIKDPDIPIVAFERVAEREPARVQKILATLLEDKDFSIEHLYAVLLHYKEPVEGLNELKDDERLWDLFDGNNDSASPGKKSASKAKLKTNGKSPAPVKKSTAGNPATKAAKSAKGVSRSKTGGKSESAKSKTTNSKTTNSKTTNSKTTNSKSAKAVISAKAPALKSAKKATAAKTVGAARKVAASGGKAQTRKKAPAKKR